MNNECSIRRVLFDFVFFEYGKDLTFEESISNFLSDYNGKIFPIAESNFATDIEFYCKTIFNIDALTLKNSLINCDTEVEVVSQIKFENPEKLKDYLNMSSFDDLLLLDIPVENIEAMTT